MWYNVWTHCSSTFLQHCYLRGFRIYSGNPSSKMLPELGWSEFVWSLVLQVFCQFWKLCCFCWFAAHWLIQYLLLHYYFYYLYTFIYNFCFNSARLLSSSGNQLCLIQIKNWLVCFIFFLNVKHGDLLKLSPKSFHRYMWKSSHELTRSLVSNYIKYQYEQLQVSSESLWVPYVFFWLPLM